jgi:hypothetical protein
MYETMENYAFDSYDPSGFNDYVAMGDNFEDASGRPAPTMRAPRQGFRALGGVGQVDILLTNNITAAVTTIDTQGITKFDLFNYNRSGGTINNTAFSSRTVSGLMWEEFAATNPGIFTTGTATAAQIAAAKANKIIFGSDGSLYYSGGAIGTTVNTEFLQISCRQLPYRTLLNSSSGAPFLVSKMRLTVPTNASQASLQINQDFTHVTNTFLGAQKSNPISPRAFFNPNQFQTNIVDIKAAYAIDAEKGLSYQVVNAVSNAAPETTTVTLFVPAFEKPASAKVFS